MRRVSWLLVGFLWCLPSAGLGAPRIDTYEFPDSETEALYQRLVAELRCPNCLNTNIIGSDAPIAQDLRRVVYRLVVTDGYDRRQVRDFLRDRYGDFVLYEPPVQPNTYALWFALPIMFCLGIVWLIVVYRRQRVEDGVVVDVTRRAERLLQED